jgi:hypothetical protein
LCCLHWDAQVRAQEATTETVACMASVRLGWVRGKPEGRRNMMFLLLLISFLVDSRLIEAVVVAQKKKQLPKER